MKQNLNPKRWWKVTRFFIICVLPAAVLATLIACLWPTESNQHFGQHFSQHFREPLKIGHDNFIGFATEIAVNGGLDVNEDSRAVKEFGLRASIRIIPTQEQLIAALKAGAIDVAYATTDILPLLMDEGDSQKNASPSDLVVMQVKQFVALVDSRGGDAIVVDNSIGRVEDLRGKTVACAIGWPSNTMLDYVLKAEGFTAEDINLLEEGGRISSSKVNVLTFPDPVRVKEAFINRQVDAAVVWAPDNIECTSSRSGTRQLICSEDMPYTLVDVLICKASTLETRKEEIKKLTKAVLTANAEVQNEGKYMWAAEAYKKYLSPEQPINDIIEGMKCFRFLTYGDNLNFFNLNPHYRGVTGSDIYNKMAQVYSSEYGNHLFSVASWDKVSTTTILNEIKGEMTESIHEAEAPIEFEHRSEEDEINPTPIFTRKLVIQFDIDSYKLKPSQKRDIKAFIGTTAKEFSNMRVRVEGNTDSTGDRQYNILLSRKRAQAVVDFLVEEYGFDPNRFDVIGNGPDKPVSADKALNRRTEFGFYK